MTRSPSLSRASSCAGLIRSGRYSKYSRQPPVWGTCSTTGSTTVPPWHTPRRKPWRRDRAAPPPRNPRRRSAAPARAAPSAAAFRPNRCGSRPHGPAGPDPCRASITVMRVAVVQFGTGLQGPVRHPIGHDVVVVFLQRRKLVELDHPVAPVAPRLHPHAGPPLVHRLNVEIAAELAGRAASGRNRAGPSSGNRSSGAPPFR